MKFVVDQTAATFCMENNVIYITTYTVQSVQRTEATIILPIT